MSVLQLEISRGHSLPVLVLLYCLSLEEFRNFQNPKMLPDTCGIPLMTDGSIPGEASDLDQCSEGGGLLCSLVPSVPEATILP